MFSRMQKVTLNIFSSVSSISFIDDAGVKLNWFQVCGRAWT